MNICGSLVLLLGVPVGVAGAFCCKGPSVPISSESKAKNAAQQFLVSARPFFSDCHSVVCDRQMKKSLSEEDLL